MTKNEKEIQELENARTKYQAAIHMSSFEGEVLWSRYSAMLIVNTIFIALLGFSYSKEFVGTILSSSLVRIISPMLGLVLCYLWLEMTNRGFMWMTHWIIEARKIEKNQLFGDINPVASGKELKEKIGGKVTQKASSMVIFIIAIVYFFLLFSNIV